jgi:hypothetical protein
MSSQEDARADQKVRLVVYRHFVSTGAAPDLPALATPLALTPEQMESSLRRLGAQRVLVLEG